MGTSSPLKTTRPLTILPHQGLGDLILCIGLFRSLLKSHSSLEILVTRKYLKSMSAAFSKTPAVRVTPLPKFPEGIFFSRLELLSGYLIGATRRIVGRKFLPLGYLGRNFFGVRRSLRFDQSFYAQAKVEFSNRWDSFLVDSLNERADQLRILLRLEDDPYVFIHEDPSRGFIIKRNLLPEGIRVISPLPPSSGYDIWDYGEVLRQADEIHVIESSFAAFVESLDIRSRKSAHRYSRPEAKGDWNHEFTYKSDWHIIL
jgi:hypothetical protein